MRIRGPLLALTLVIPLMAGPAAPAGAAALPPAALPPTVPSAVPAATPAAAGATTTVHDVTVVMIDPAGVAVDYTRQDALDSLATVDAFYARESAGAIRFRVVAALDWATPDEAVDCDDFDALLDLAQRRSGFVPGRDRHLVAMTPDGSCPYALGDQAESIDEGGRVDVSSTDPTTLAHELGHTLSLHHTSSIQCSGRWDLGSAVGLPSTCTRDEYGNSSDVMGAGGTFYPFTPGSLARLGLIRHEVVPACGAARRITIDTSSASPDATRLIRWADPAHPGIAYYVQYRDVVDNRAYASLYPSPFATSDDAPTGVQVYRTDPMEHAAAAVLSRPGDTSRARQRIRAGERVPLDDGMSVSVVALDTVAHRATVDVTVPCATSGTAGEQQLPASAVLGVRPPVVVADRVRV